MSTETSRRSFLKTGTGFIIGLLFPGCVQTAPDQKPTLLPDQIANAVKKNELSARATAEYLDLNPEVLKQEIQKIPEDLWFNASRIIHMDWRRDPNTNFSQAATVVSVPDTGSCTILGNEIVTAGHMLHAPGFILKSLTIDWPQAIHDHLREETIPDSLQIKRQNPQGITVEVESTAYSFTEDDLRKPDLGVIKLKKPWDLWGGMTVSKYVDGDDVFTLLMSRTTAAKKQGLTSFKTGNQEYLPFVQKALYKYEGENSKYLVLPAPAIKGMSGTGIYCNGWIGSAGVSALTSQGESVIVVTLAEGIFHQLLNQLG